MRKGFVSLLTTICIIVSVFSFVHAASATGEIKLGDYVYSWSYTLVDNSYGFLELIKTNKTTASGGTFADYSNTIDRVNIYNPDFSEQYTFTVPANLLKNVHVMHIIGSCTKVNNLSYCPWLEKLTFNNSKKSYVDVDYSNLTKENFPEITINQCPSDFEVYLDFTNFKGFDSVTVPAAYSKNGIYYSFEDSTALRTANFEKGTTYIPLGAFEGCSNLSTVVIPSGVTSIEYMAFYKCASLKKISIPSSVKSIGCNAFDNSGLKEITYYGTSVQWNKLINERESDGTLIGNALHLDGTVINCSDGKMIIKKVPSVPATYVNIRVGWLNLGNGKWQFFNNDGSTPNNKIQNIDGVNYAFGSEGLMLTGWVEFSGNWYFFNKSGAMATGWLNNNNKWYYLDATGCMITGWKEIGGKWYYFNSDGAMATGWNMIDGYYYFLKSDGSMASNEFCQGYWLETNGKWIYKAKASWYKDSKGWYYQDTNGWYAKNATYKIDGKNYNFNSAGYCTNP